MSEKRRDNYTFIAILLHWLIAAVVLYQLGLGVYMTRSFVTLAEKATLFPLHKSIGLTILALSLLRLAWRLMHPAPPFAKGVGAMERLAARIVHYSFYVILIALPLSGWIIVSTAPLDIPTVVFGQFSWPHIPFPSSLGDKHAIYESSRSVHEFLAFSTIGLFILHVSAALMHHVFGKNETLVRMLPMLRRK